MTKGHARAEVVRHWWGKALTSLEAARRDAAAGDYAYAINRAYYALFYAISGDLVDHGPRILEPYQLVRQLISVPTARTYADSIRPFMPAATDLRTAQQQGDELLDIDDVLGKRVIHTRLWPTIMIRDEHSAGALEVMSRVASDPRWLIYLPPRMSPPNASEEQERLEDLSAA